MLNIAAMSTSLRGITASPTYRWGVQKIFLENKEGLNPDQDRIVTLLYRIVWFAGEIIRAIRVNAVEILRVDCGDIY